MLVVYTCGQAVTREELGALIPRHASQRIFRTEEPLRGVVGIGCSVVNLVPSEVGIHTQTATRPVVMILQSSRHDTARYPLVGVIERTANRSRMRGVEVRNVNIGIDIPVSTHFVAYLGIAAILLKAHPRTVVVGSGVLAGYGRREPSLAYLIGGLSLKGAIAACA